MNANFSTDFSKTTIHLNDPVVYQWASFSQSSGDVSLHDLHAFSNTIDTTSLGTTSYAGIDTNRFGHNPNLIQGKNNSSEEGTRFVNRPVFLGQMVECIHAAAPVPRRS